MSKDEKKIDLLADDTPNESSATDSTTLPEIAEELDEESKMSARRARTTLRTNRQRPTAPYPRKSRRSWTRRRRNSARCGAIFLASRAAAPPEL